MRLSISSGWVIASRIARRRWVRIRIPWGLRRISVRAGIGIAALSRSTKAGDWCGD